MNETETPATFFARFDRWRLLGRSPGSWLGILFLAALIAGGTATIAMATAEGTMFQKLEPSPRAHSGHVVRSHGWGGYYLLVGRRHFGGGGRIH